METRYRVRPAVSDDDLSSVLGVLAENEALAPVPAPPSAAPEASPRQSTTWARIQRTSDVTVYLAECHSGAVGTACLSLLPNLTYDCRPTAFIEAVVVTYAHRRRGVASLLLQTLLRDAGAAGAYKVQLLTHKRHASDGAHDLYRSLGFQAEAEGFRLYLE
ncbi:GNAT family N-acetyltransferase [Mumia sp. zg.B53]|uniref:GNAT family N-acetyltransferase n=1 Tax=unclassified Mumia TaxID=2621872 RepID=UPI001C6E21CF|nr:MULTISPECIES: GNAT family N-acetyltransferase [unclassified Mumia]MBW9205043.1 GNAT family N-acetyltransferase [Mumia sp. zg.B17]MBW9208953.1 GNAT family N-acetyltransferase [Mumia sp. zg.B21]MBW9213565.1 GNAT family N-acetyltransferase [Mumia sp. zg.B53]